MCSIDTYMYVIVLVIVTIIRKNDEGVEIEIRRDYIVDYTHSKGICVYTIKPRVILRNLPLATNRKEW